NLMYVVDLWGFPIAQAWVDLEKRREARAALLWAVRVFPLFQGQGIGRFMLEQVERRTEARGMWALELGVEKDNARAQSFYERLGYRHVGELSECYRYEMEGAG